MDPRFGTWGDVERISSRFDLCLDLTINHISDMSVELQDFLANGKASEYADLFVHVDQLSEITPDDMAKIHIRKEKGAVPRSDPSRRHGAPGVDELHGEADRRARNHERDRPRKGNEMLKTIVAVLGGYGLFAVSAVLLFQLSGVDPHDPSSLAVRVFGIGFGAAFALASGYMAAKIAGERGTLAAGLVAGIMVVAGLGSLLARPGAGDVWTQVASIVVFAPLVLAGARLGRNGTTALPG